MSVRMALAKLCACACGGAVVGAGAMHVAESPKVHHRIKVKTQPRAYAAPKVRARAKPRQIAKAVATNCVPAAVTVTAAPAVA